MVYERIIVKIFLLIYSLWYNIINKIYYYKNIDM